MRDGDSSSYSVPRPCTEKSDQLLHAAVNLLTAERDPGRAGLLAQDPVILHDNLKRQSHKPYGTPTSVT